MSADLYPTGGTKLIHRGDRREFGAMVHSSLIEARDHQREIKMDMMRLLEKLESNKVSQEKMKELIFGIYKKMK